MKVNLPLFWNKNTSAQIEDNLSSSLKRINTAEIFINEQVTFLKLPRQKLVIFYFVNRKKNFSSAFFRVMRRFFGGRTSYILFSNFFYPFGTFLCALSSLFITTKSEKFNLVNNNDYYVLRNDNNKYFFPNIRESFAFLRHIYIEENEYLRKVSPKSGDFAIDVGANIGAFALRLLALVGDGGNVIAIEPDPQTYKFLKLNLYHSGAPNVESYNLGLWSSKGTLKINVGLSSIRDHSFFGHGDHSVEVKTDTLDNLLSNISFTKVNFLKVNIEGAEIEMLKGSDQTLDLTQTTVVAAEHVIDGKKTCEEVISILSSKGFEVVNDPQYDYVSGHKS